MRYLTIKNFLAFAFYITIHTNLMAEAREELAYRLKSSVVKVHVGTKNGGHGVGTGVAISKDLVATNCHVLANSIGVSISKYGENFVPVALKADWKHDLCILRFQYADLTPVELGDSDHLHYEQAIFSIGFPGGPPKPQYTEGKIKALYPLDDSHIIRTDASFVMGASGSPVFNDEGQLLGISTFKSPGKNAYYYNLPVKWVKALLAQTETTSMETDVSPFWDATELERPFFMRVVQPFKNEKWDDLMAVAESWVQSEPDSAEAFYYAGIAEENRGHLIQAQQHFAQALALEPEHLAAKAALACTKKTKLACDTPF